MVLWHQNLLVYVNDQYDRDNASDGTSRYGAYLRQNHNLFRDAWSDTPGPITDPAEFAVHAWRVATGPIMVPGYVWTRPDLGKVTLHRDEEDGSLYVDIHVPLRHSHIGGNAKRFPYAWQDWESEADYSGAEYTSLFEPRSNKKPSVLTTTVVRIPGRDWSGLVTPTAYEGRTLLEESRQAVFTVAQHINDDAGPMVAKLLGDKA